MQTISIPYRCSDEGRAMVAELRHIYSAAVRTASIRCSDPRRRVIGFRHDNPNSRSWVTEDRDTALWFARDKVEVSRGEPLVYRFEPDEDDVEWDVISAAAGVDDLRGRTRVPLIAGTPEFNQPTPLSVATPADRRFVDEEHVERR